MGADLYMEGLMNPYHDPYPCQRTGCSTITKVERLLAEACALLDPEHNESCSLDLAQWFVRLKDARVLRRELEAKKKAATELEDRKTAKAGRARQEALAKLTDEERVLLGVKEQP